MKKIYQDYVERDNKDFKVQLYYNLGGESYTGRIEKRGYYLSVIPVKLEDNGHFMIETTVAWSGIKECLLEVKRSSKKAEQQAMDMLTDEFINERIDYVIRMNKKAA